MRSWSWWPCTSSERRAALHSVVCGFAASVASCHEGCCQALAVAQLQRWPALHPMAGPRAKLHPLTQRLALSVLTSPQPHSPHAALGARLSVCSPSCASRRGLARCAGLPALEGAGTHPAADELAMRKLSGCTPAFQSSVLVPINVRMELVLPCLPLQPQGMPSKPIVGTAISIQARCWARCVVLDVIALWWFE